MSAQASLRAIFLFAALSAEGLAVTPVGKVVELLKNLEGQISTEGATEAAQYDRYACFCKEQAGVKVAAIDKSAQKIEELDAEITSLETSISDLNRDIEKLAMRVTDLDDEISGAVAVRTKEHEAYVLEEKDMSEAVSALTRAIQALKDSKKQMTNAKLNLIQVQDVQALIERAFQTVGRSSVVVRETSAQLQLKLKALAAAAPQAGSTTEKQYAAQHSYEYRSNDIIATLQDLLKTFKQDKKKLDENEMTLRDAFDENVQGLSNEKKFAEKEQAEKEDAVSVKTEQLHTAEDDKEKETIAKKADESFQASLTEACGNKAKSWDERSKMRATELSILAEAREVLQGAVERQYASIKKEPVGLLNDHKAVPQKSSISAAASELAANFVHDSDDSEVSFLQLQKHSFEAVGSRLLGFLQGESTRLQSSVLSSLAIKLDLGSSVAIDHFVRVRSIIKDLIDTLKASAEDEASQKTFCDKNMKMSLNDRDEAQLKVEELTAEITLKAAEVEQTLEEIAALQKAIAELHNALNEASELRASEKAGNEKIIADAVAGKEAVAQAIKILEAFWSEAGDGFLQRAKKQTYVPANSDREGQTVGDRAPETFEGDYGGSQGHAASGGILGILDLILKDFEHAETSVADEETAAQKEFDTFKTDTETDIHAKTQERGEKEAKVVTLKEEINTAKEHLVDANKAKEQALEGLEKLSAMCVETEDWEERKAKREQEIEALKQALQILSDWQN